MKDHIFKPFKKVRFLFDPGETAVYFPVLNINTVDIRSHRPQCYIFKEMTAPTDQCPVRNWGGNGMQKRKKGSIPAKLTPHWSCRLQDLPPLTLTSWLPMMCLVVVTHDNKAASVVNSVNRKFLPWNLTWRRTPPPPPPSAAAAVAIFKSPLVVWPLTQLQRRSDKTYLSMNKLVPL